VKLITKFTSNDLLLLYSLEQVVEDSAALAAVRLAVLLVHHLPLLELRLAEAVVVVLDVEEDGGKKEDEVKKVEQPTNLVQRRWTAMATWQWEAFQQATAKVKARVKRKTGVLLKR